MEQTQKTHLEDHLLTNHYSQIYNQDLLVHLETDIFGNTYLLLIQIVLSNLIQQVLYLYLKTGQQIMMLLQLEIMPLLAVS